MFQKKQLIDRCQDLVGLVSSAEEDMAAAVRSLRDEGVAQMEQDQRAFRAGAEDRRAKVHSLSLQISLCFR